MSAVLLLLALASAPTRVVVGVEAEDLFRAESAATVAQILGAVNGVEVRRLRRALVVDADAQSPAQLAARLAGRPGVRWIEAEVTFPVRLRQPPNDPLYPDQWNLHGVTDPAVHPDVDIAAELAWTITTGRLPGGEPVRIAVIDDGFDLTHPDLRFAAGYDVASDDGPSGYDDDPSWEGTDLHGTQTAGVAAALGDNGLGLSGVCPDCELLPVRLTGGGGPPDLFTTGSALAAAIEWAALVGGAAVINNSWGPPDGNPFDPDHVTYLWPRADGDRPGGELPLVVQEALRAAVTDGRDGRGAVITWSAGNGNELVTYDGFAHNPWVLAIGSVDASGRRAYYSDFGPPIFLVAPSSGGGADPKVLTTDIAGTAGESLDDYFTEFGGTSAAAAQVAGAAALVIAAYPDLYAAQVIEALARSAFPIDGACDRYANGRSPEYGHGRLDVAAALAAAALYTDDCSFELELCANDRDDDCDGVVDEAEQCELCRPDDSGGEICDGLDNDCDGAIDEAFVCVSSDRPVCAPCADSGDCALGSRCRASPEFPGTFCFIDCTADADLCAPGFACNGEVCLLEPSETCGHRDCTDFLSCGGTETCSGRDDDCNGVVDDVDDESAEASAARDACDGLGVCAGRGAVCEEAAWRCVRPADYAFTEICNDDLDNDCDGHTDESCPPASTGDCAGVAPSALAAWLTLATLWRRRRRRAR